MHSWTGPLWFYDKRKKAMRVRSVGEREGGLGWLNLGINVNLNIHLSIKMNVVPTNYCEKPVPGLSWRKRLLEVPNVVRKAYWKFHDLWWRHVSCIPQLDGGVIGCRGNQRMAAFSVSDTTGPDFCWVTRQFLPFWTFIVWRRHTKHLQGKKNTLHLAVFYYCCFNHQWLDPYSTK